MCEISGVALRVGNSRWRAVRGLTNSDCLETRRPICSCAQRQQSLRKFKSLPCANEALWAALSGINNGMHATTCQARPMHQPKKKRQTLEPAFLWALFTFKSSHTAISGGRVGVGVRILGSRQAKIGFS